MLPVLLLLLVIEILLRQIPNDYRLKKEYLDKHASEVEILILGSSHAFFGFNPIYFKQPAFNLSHISQSLNYDYALFDLYKTKFIKLKTIVVPISYFTLYDRLEDSSESWRVKNYIIYYGTGNPTSVRDYSEILSNRFDLNIDRLSAHYVSHVPNISCNNLGWGTTYKSNNAQNLLETGRTAAIRHTKDIKSSKGVGTYNANVGILKSIIRWGETHHVNVILVTPPAFETYRQNLDLEQLDNTVETATELAARYDNCTYVNLLNDTNFIAKDYYDADHLSEIGSKKLSLLIQRYLY